MAKRGLAIDVSASSDEEAPVAKLLKRSSSNVREHPTALAMWLSVSGIEGGIEQGERLNKIVEHMHERKEQEKKEQNE